MRPLVALALAALVIAGMLIAGMRGALPWWNDALGWSVALAAGGALAGAAVSAAILFTLVRFRLGRLVKA
ncbi:MAG TPA: hypothetical protein VFW02_05120, partial [Candidatus Limnocylindrales bacterium]|nr:hypothetical protein [Candidatus Limnocylindrales bacterium]